MTRLTTTRNVLLAATGGLLLASYLFVYEAGHDAGYEAGQRDLCGEMGGTHVVEDATYSWCDR